MSNAWQRDSHAGNAGIAIIFYKKRPIFCRNTQIDLVPDKEHIFKTGNSSAAVALSQTSTNILAVPRSCQRVLFYVSYCTVAASTRCGILQFRF